MRCLVLPLLLCACAQFPELDTPQTQDLSKVPFPKLKPLNVLLDNPEPTLTDDSSSELLARLEQLRARAKRLKTAQF